jgi:iron complex outermembrane recepter protein
VHGAGPNRRRKKQIRVEDMLHGNSRILLAALLAGSPVPVLAQAAADPGGEIIVTAQKREQRLIDVPVGISALNGDALAQRNIQTVNDLAFYIPGLSLRYDGPGSSQIFMRGVANIRGSDAVVASYMDDIPVTLTGGFRQIDLRALDLDRVEVLKGPQGTLYGQGAMAGTVRYVTTNPSLTTIEGYAKADVAFIEKGSTNPKLSGAISVPIIKDVLAVRVAADWEQGGGWIDQPAAGIRNGNNQNVLNLRAKILFQPSPDFDATATIMNYRMDSKFGLDYENPDDTRPVPVPGDPAAILPPRHDIDQVYNLAMNYHFSFATLTSSTSYVVLNRDYTTTYIAGPGTTSAGLGNEGYDAYHDRAHQFTQEVRLTAPKGDKLQYTLGAFYRDAHGDLDDNETAYYLGATYLVPYRDYDMSKSLSLFADAGYELLTRFTLGAGVRYFRDKESMIDVSNNYQSATFHSVDPRVYFTYRINPTWNIYGNVSKGFRSGGFNTSGLPAYNPETLWNFELGTKGDALGGRVHFDLDGFHSIYDNSLRTGQFFNYPAGYVSYTRNIGTLQIWGVEAETAWRATKRLTLSVNGAYIDGEVTRLAINTAEGETANVQVGDGLDYTPKLSFTAAADYTFPIGPAASGFVHADYVHRSTSCATDSSIFIPVTQCAQTIDLVNARIGAKFDGYTVEAYVANLGNVDRVVDPYYAWSQSAHTRPRTFGVAVTRKF